MRAVLVAIALCGTSPAWAAKVPAQECAAQFVREWSDNKVAMVEDPRRMPTKACLMRTDKGDYVCSKVGCVSAYAYTNDD